MARQQLQPDASVSTANLTLTVLVSYAAAAFLLSMLILWAGVWEWMANTRVLRILMESGVVALTDADQGFILGVPDLEHFVKASDPINFGLVIAAMLLFCVFWMLKAIQFHLIAEYSGAHAPFGQHLRAYLYGEGMNRLVPFNFGMVATVASLEASGVSRKRATFTTFTSRLFYVFEIVVFAIVGLLLVGWATWGEIALWALAIFAAGYLVMRNLVPARSESNGAVDNAWRSVLVLTQSPLRLLLLCALSIIAFLLLDVIAYTISNAFSGEFVIIHVETSLLLVALVAGHIARLFPVTPDGIGQFEWGFALALYVGGLGAPEAAALAVLFSFTRHLTAMLVLGATVALLGTGTSLRRTLNLFRGDGVIAETT